MGNELPAMTVVGYVDYRSNRLVILGCFDGHMAFSPGSTDRENVGPWIWHGRATSVADAYTEADAAYRGFRSDHMVPGTITLSTSTVASPRETARLLAPTTVPAPVPAWRRALRGVFGR